METLEPILAQHPFFQDVDPVHRQLMAGCAANVRFPASADLFREGDAADQFYLIRHGSVALQVFIPGQGRVTLETIRAGEVLGWSWLFPPYIWYFDARALEPTRALALDARCLRGKCDRDPKLGYELMKRFSSILHARMQAAGKSSSLSLTTAAANA